MKKVRVILICLLAVFIVQAGVPASATQPVGTAGVNNSPPQQSGTPAPPSNLHVTAVTQNSITLSWQDNSNNEQGFKVYRWNGFGCVGSGCGDPLANYNLIGTTGANVTTYTDNGRNCGVSYTYKVTAYNGSVQSVPTSSATASTASCSAPTTPPSSGVPAAPSNLHVTRSTQTSISLAWQDNATGDHQLAVYRWDGGTFKVIDILPANTTFFDEFTPLSCDTSYTYRVTAFNNVGDSPPAQIDARTAACSAPPSPNIYITEVGWDAAPTAYIPATLIVRGTATALPTGSGSFKVNVLIDTGFLSRPLDYWLDSADADSARYITPAQIQNGNFEIRISHLEMPRIVGGRLAVTIISNADPNIQGANVKPLDVASSSQGYRACYEPLYMALSTLFDFLPFDLPKKVGQYAKATKDAIDLTKLTLEAGDSLENCHGDTNCALGVLRQWAIALNEHSLDHVLGAFPLGRIAVAMRDAILAAPDLVNCAVWCLNEIGDLAKYFNQRGHPSNALTTHSPVYPLVTDHSGRRAGFLPDGTQINEIPDAQVLTIGDKRLVVYPSQDSSTVTIVGYAAGTMTVDAVFATAAVANGGGVALNYTNVPVAPGMVAHLDSNDPQANLQLDTNGDGRIDQTRAADTRETLTGASSSHTFAETSQAISGRFWAVWQSGRSYENSLYINGFPITDKHDEVSLTDGRTYKVQWFERARYEEHPENQQPYDVLIGLLGVQAVKGRSEASFHPVSDPNNGLQWFPQTQHTLGDASEGGQAIARFWQQLGGLSQFGYPLSQPFIEVNKADGRSYLVQYFERQRFEYHPENKGTRYEVQLGLLGAEQQGRGSTPNPKPTADCSGIPPSLDVEPITPNCAPNGSAFEFWAKGFTPNEKVSAWITLPNQQVEAPFQTTADDSGKVGLRITMDKNLRENEGINADTVEGISSHHKVIYYFKVLPP